ncbi:MAG TPA: double-strand break repair protein AddB [Rhizomicrobium sp.]
MSAKIFTIPASAPFADTLARGLVQQLQPQSDPLALARATIYLPTRRAARTLTEAFARVLGGAALLPEIRPLGDVDEDEFLFDPSADDFDLTPAISPIRRQILLATLIARWSGRRGRDLNFAQAAGLARALASFLDDAQRQNADLSKLENLVPKNLAAHWADVHAFLSLLAELWPSLLADENRQDPAAYTNASLRALARRFEKNPPPHPVIAAGSTGSIPATAELLGVIAGLPHGAVILPGLDHALDETSWNDLDPGHPQFGMKQLLARIGIVREDVRDWNRVTPPNVAREKLLRETLRPAPTTDAWRALSQSGASEIAQGLKGLALVEAAHPAEEAASIALILREALETPGQTAALVTPDRNLARRVTAELGRWNIDIDDSAGRPLAHTPVGSFLCLIAEAADEDFAVVSLLALLKHPFSILGEEPAQFRRRARQLDLALRGPAPDAGLDGIAKALAHASNSDLSAWFARVADVLRPLEKTGKNSIADLLSAHISAAEQLAATNSESGPSILWRGEAGEAARLLMLDLEDAASDIPAIDHGSYALFFRHLAEKKAVRPAFGKHPRVAILGPLEARLQSFDLVVLGGLNEGTWPADVPADPWLSRPMRGALGLEQPERAIGLAAHDFATLAAAPRVILSRARKAEGTPTVSSRWLQRLIQLTRGLGLEKNLHASQSYPEIAAALSEPSTTARMERPAPRPPVSARPRKLSVTEIETWLRDPYAIYARRVLGLEPLDPLDAEIGPLERGTLIHRVLEKFLLAFPDEPPVDGEFQLIRIADEVFAKENVPASALALWRPRFHRAARWFIGVEHARRVNILRSHIEQRGERTFKAPGGDFLLHGRADRIDELRSGGGAIVDYKSGKPPTNKQVKQIIAAQLPLEAAMLFDGGFAATGKLSPEELLYIHFSGGAKPGDVQEIDGDIAQLAAKAAQLLAARIAQFDDEDQPYLPRVMPYRADQAGDYDHLARVREWSLAGWGEADE